jgi:hypothetical protein
VTNTVYPKGKEALLGSLNLLTDDIRVLVVDLDLYTYNAAHDFLDDVAGGAQIKASGSMTGKTVTNGVFDAADTPITAVPTADHCGLIIYAHTGTPSTSALIYYIDTGTNIMFNPNGGDVLVQWNASGIFAI